MKRTIYYMLLVIAVLAIVVFVGVAAGFWVIRPVANDPSGLLTNFLDFFYSSIYLLLAALISFFIGLIMRFLNYNDHPDH